MVCAGRMPQKQSLCATRGLGITATRNLGTLHTLSGRHVRCRPDATEAVTPHDTWIRNNSDKESEDPAHQLTSLRSTMFGGSQQPMMGGKQSQAPGLSHVLRMMQLDDYQIKPSEIEIMTNLDGSPATLGRGAFGEVRSSHKP